MFVLNLCCRRQHKDRLSLDRTGCLVSRYADSLHQGSSSISISASNNLNNNVDPLAACPSAISMVSAPRFLPYRTEPDDTVRSELLAQIPREEDDEGEAYTLSTPGIPGFFTIGYTKMCTSDFGRFDRGPKLSNEPISRRRCGLDHQGRGMFSCISLMKLTTLALVACATGSCGV